MSRLVTSCDRLAVVARLLQEPPGQVEVLLVVDLLPHGAVPHALLGEEQARLEAIERRLVPGHAAHDRLHVEPPGDGLPRLDLVERRPVRVELEDHLREGLQHDRLEARRAADPLVRGRGQRHRVVEVAALETGEPRRAFTGGDDVNLVHQRRAVSAEPRRGHPAVPRVVVEALQGDLLVPHPLGETEGPGAHELGRLERILRVLDQLLRHDREERHRVGHGAEEGALRLFEGDADGRRIDHGHCPHCAEIAAPRPELDEAVDGRLDVVGGDGPPAVEAHAGAQLERVV